ncbi:hypothetical protein [Bradyrhizobium sp. ORS 285]|uniref:hypothetical protein n=1 Tax=Bradyrhizobium sp. ORS 285 TaxID=115808 RepID=UPI0006801A0B|nr:hypothetical protein [Bradyrhizobium sp. ORS 285]
MSEQKAEQTSLGTASPVVIGAEPPLKTSASPDVVDKAVPAIAPVAQPTISPDHEAPSADQPVMAANTAAAEAPASEPKAQPVADPVAAVAAADAHPATETKAEAVKVEPAKTDEIKTDESKAGSPPVESVKAEVSKPEPKRLDLVKSDKGKSEKKAETAKADPLKLNAGQSSSSQTAAKSPPTILDLIRTEPAKPAEPVKSATAAGDLLKVETPKLSTLASNAPKIGPMGTTTKPETPVKPDAVSKPAAVKPDVAVKSEAAAKPEAVLKPELAAKPEPTAKPEVAVKPEAAAKVDAKADAKRPAVEPAPVSKAGRAGAAVDKATAWAKAKLKAEPFASDAATKPSPAAAAMAGGAAAALPPKPPGNSASRLPAPARLGLPAMAAVLLLAMVVGGVAGGLVTATLIDRSGGSSTAEATGAGAADPTLSAAVSRIDNEIANLKASLDQTNQTSLVELNKSAERLDRLEKVLGELATKASGKPSELQRLSDAVERLRAAQASATSQPSTRDTNTASVPQAVGAINAAAPPSGVPMRQEASRAEPARTEASTPSRTEPSRAEATRTETARAEAARTEATKPKVVEGWVLRDVGRGGALIEGRGGLYEVYAGDPVPGLGKVDAIRKQDGRWVVFTTKGLVVAR